MARTRHRDFALDAFEGEAPAYLTRDRKRRKPDPEGSGAPPTPPGTAYDAKPIQERFHAINSLKRRAHGRAPRVWPA